MITEIEVNNYKSIEKLTIKLGRVNVFIGENGAGKSNIVEVIALAGAAAAEKLDNEFLATRGIRVTKPEHMRPAFPGFSPASSILITAKNNNESAAFSLTNDNAPYSKWSAIREDSNVTINFDTFSTTFAEYLDSVKDKPKEDIAKVAAKQFIEELADKLQKSLKENRSLPKRAGKEVHSINLALAPSDPFAKLLSQARLKRSRLSEELSNFVIYSPENSSLRTPAKEGYIEPLGINGEGILKLISYYSAQPDSPVLARVKSSLKVLGWFEDLKLSNTTPTETLEIRDRYIEDNVRYLDYTSANEGFFFLLFYFLLFNSELTPRFFALDNIDASLNPKLCEKLLLELVQAAKENDKQAILTTHNPSILDGLNLDDDEQRLFVVSRGPNGTTRLRRIHKPKAGDNKNPYRLSELFIRGMLGGLPKGF